MSTLNISLDLSPLPSPRDGVLRFGLHLFGAAASGADAQLRIVALSADLSGAFPESPDDADGFMPWADVEQAFAMHWGEFLPWLWSAYDVWLQVGDQRLKPSVLDKGDTLAPASLVAARRGFLKAIYTGSERLKDSSRFARDSSVASGTQFNFPTLSVQATRWPAPVPQEALRTVMVLEIARDAVAAALPANPPSEQPPTVIGASLTLSVANRSYPDPGLRPWSGNVLNWTVAAGGDTVTFESSGLLASTVLTPPTSNASYLHPARSLWLRNALAERPDYEVDEAGPGQSMADHDWWSRLHDGVSAAAEIPRLLIEALRQAPESTHIPAAAAKVVWALIGSLRDLLAPGITVATTSQTTMYPYHRSPLAISLLSLWRELSGTAAATLDLFAIGRDDTWIQALQEARATDDLGRIGLVYALLYREGHAAPTRLQWYSEFRKLSPTLQKRLPEPDSRGGTDDEKEARALAALADELSLLSQSERIELAELLRTDSTRPAVRMKSLLDSWDQAVIVIDTDPADLKTAKLAGKTFLDAMRAQPDVASYFKDHDPSVLYLATAALNVPSEASKPQVGDPATMRLAARIARATLQHVTSRMSASSVMQPRLAITAADFPGLEAAAETLADAAYRAVCQRDGVDATGQPSPIILEVDTLNGDVDDQAGEPDLNVWLSGYSAFWRRVLPASAQSPWGCGQLGVIEMQMWPDHPLMIDKDEKPVLALAPSAATTNYGVRQVLLTHDNRPTLPDAGVDTVVQTDDGKQANDWEATRGFVVVADRGRRGDTKLARLPFVGFGMDYEAIVFAQGRSGVLPSELAGRYADTAPYCIDAATDVDAIGKSDQLRTLSYRRRVRVSEPRIKYREPLRTALGAGSPQGWNPSNASRHLNLAQAAWPDDPADARPVYVVLSKAGLSEAAVLPPAWSEVEFRVMPPACTWTLYDRWVAYDVATSSGTLRAAWETWRKRIHASELFLARLKTDDLTSAEMQTLNELAKDPATQLDDPAVSAVLVTWTPLRSKSISTESRLVPLERPTGPLEPSDATSDDLRIAYDRGRAGPPDWTLVIRPFAKADEKRFDVEAGHRIVVRLWPGEIGDLSVASAVAEKDLAERCDLVPEQTVSDDKGNYGVFGQWISRFEVPTADVLSPEELQAHCRTVVGVDGSIQLRWNRHEVPEEAALERALLAVDNVVAIKPSWQIWHGTGRPLPTFPHDVDWLDDMQQLAAPPDGSPDPSASGVIWDAQGFADRFASSARDLGAIATGLGSTFVVLHEDKAAGTEGPRYARYLVEATHRYAPVYLPLLTLDKDRAPFAPVRGRRATQAIIDRKAWVLHDEWIRGFRPGFNPINIPRPPVRMVVPLTRSLTRRGRARGADLLVVLQEELNTTSPLATRLEAVIESAHRDYADSGAVSMLERGSDPIVKGTAQTGTMVALDCIGPLGHHFDTDTREPKFTGVSYLVQSGGVLEDWEFAKLSFRRVIAPELMTGYYAAPASPEAGRLIKTPTAGRLELTFEQLERHWQGHLTLQGLQVDRDHIPIEIGFFGQTLTLGLKRSTPPTGQGSLWQLSCSNLPKDAFVDSELQLLQDFKADPGSRLRSPHLRVIAARILEPVVNPPKPARWEVAGYLAVALRPQETVAEVARPAWECRWLRVLSWQLDEPEETEKLKVSLQAGVAADHGVAQAVLRASDYTPGDWIQALPLATELPIAERPWIERRTADALGLSVEQDVGGLRSLSITERNLPAALNWQDAPVEAGDEGQGLHHRLLVTRVVPTADGTESEAYLGIFRQAGPGLNRFVPLEPVSFAGALPAGSELRAYVLLVQKSLRTAYATESLGFWDSLFPPQGGDPRDTTDARLRILAIGEQIAGAIE